MSTPLIVKAFYPNFFSDRQIAYACLSIVDGLPEDGTVSATVMGLCSDRTVDRYRRRPARPNGSGRTGIYRDAIPRGVLWAGARRVLRQEQLHRIAEARYRAGLREGDVAYLWPGTSFDVYRRARARGCTIVSECINTLRQTSREILDRESRALGIAASHGITEDSVREELRSLHASDFVFSPSPAVTESLLSAGIRSEAILPTSYGLRESELLDRSRDTPRPRTFTALFAGRICARKGVHLLLEAWIRAGIGGRLRVVGTISDEFRNLFLDRVRSCPSVEHVDYVDDLKPLYREADCFILPSVEEGSPLVTYLALGASLPVIASPMGAGGIVTDGREGFVVDPRDTDRLAGVIRTLAQDTSLRESMARAAGAAAREYTWDRVAARRRQLLLERLA